MSTKENSRLVIGKILAVVLALLVAALLFPAFSQPTFAYEDPSDAAPSDAVETGRDNEEQAARDFATVFTGYFKTDLTLSNQQVETLELSKGIEGFSLDSVASLNSTGETLFLILSILWQDRGLALDTAPQPRLTAPYLEEELGDGFVLSGEEVLFNDSIFQRTAADGDNAFRRYTFTVVLITDDANFNGYLAQEKIHALGETTVTFDVALESIWSDELVHEKKGAVAEEFTTVLTKLIESDQPLISQSQEAPEINKENQRFSLRSALPLNTEGEALFGTLSNLWEQSGLAEQAPSPQSLLTMPYFEEELGDGFVLSGEEVLFNDSIFQRTAADGDNAFRKYESTVVLTTDDAAFNEYLSQEGIPDIARTTVEFVAVLDPIVSGSESSVGSPQAHSVELASDIAVSPEGVIPLQDIPSQAVPLAGDLLSGGLLSPFATADTSSILYQNIQLAVLAVVVALGILSFLRYKKPRLKVASHDAYTDKRSASCGSVRTHRSDYLD